MNESPELFEIVQVTSGAQSLRSLRYHETFHPVVGPMVEARGLHVSQHRFIERINAAPSTRDPFIIWEIGLGAAANAIAILEAFRDAPPLDHPVELHSFDRSLEALDFALSHSSSLGYFAGWESLVSDFLKNGFAQSRNVTWKLHAGDFRERVDDPSIPPPQSIIFDPYSPASNPEIWTVALFSKLRKRIRDRPCLLTSYSRSTSVRTTFLYAGWFIGKGAATGAKEETTVAASHPELLQNPIEKKWLERVAKSGAPGPLTHGDEPPFSALLVAQTLAQHPQFSG